METPVQDYLKQLHSDLKKIIQMWRKISCLQQQKQRSSIKDELDGYTEDMYIREKNELRNKVDNSVPEKKIYVLMKMKTVMMTK